nr:uncharacterized protein LOC109157107 [Ipomoea batatas]
MDIEDIQSNLHSLRQLYGLLKQDEDGLPNVTSETLDNKARLLLKSLLDSATERVLKAHSRVDATLKCTSGQPHRLKDSVKEQHLALSNALKQSWEKQSVSSETGGLKLEGVVKPATEVGVIEMPKLVFSATESENRRKRCRVCQRPKTVKQFKPIGKAKFSDHGRPSSLRVTTLQDKPSNQSSHFCFTTGSNERGNENGVFLGGVSNGIGSVASSSNRPEFDFVKTEVRHEFTPETEGIPEDNSCLSKEVSDAIKQIEMHISALQLEAISGTNVIESESCDTVADCFLQMDISSAIKRTKGLVPSSDPSQAGAVVNDSHYHLDRQCSVEPIITTSNSLYQGPNRMMNQLTDSTSPNLAANQATMTREHMRNAGLVSKHNVSGRGEEPIDDNEMQLLKGNWLALQDIKTILNKLESAREPNSSGHDFANRTIPDCKGYSISQGQNKTVNALSSLPAINRDQDLVPLNPNPRKPRIPKSTVQMKDSEKDLQHHKTTRRTWLDSKHGHLIEARKNLYKSLKDLNHFGLSRKEKFTNYPKRRYLLEQEPEATVSSSYSSQPRSTYGSHTEDYSESGHISDRNYTDAPVSSSCSDSELYPSHHVRRRGRYIIDSSSGENEVYSSSLPDSASFLRRSSTHSGESEASSQFSQPVNSYSNDSSSKTCSPVRAYKSANVEKTKKQVGRWTKTKVNHETPLPKHKGKSPCPPRKHEVHEEQQAAQTLGKPVGLKNSKSLKHGSLQSKKGKHGNKKAVKTSHLWQLLRQHGRFKKPPALLESSVTKNPAREFSKTK